MGLYGANINPERHVNDLYSTDPKVVRDIMELEEIKDKIVLEPCVGLGHMSEELKKDNVVITNDYYDYGYYCEYNRNFLETILPVKVDIVVMNPPFRYSKQFIDKAFEYSNKVVVFEKLTFLEGVARYNTLFKQKNLKKVYVYSYRPKCYKGGNPLSGLMLAWAWYVFDSDYSGNPEIDWIYRGKIQGLS